MKVTIPKLDPAVDEVARIMDCMAVLENYDADKKCECKAFACPSCHLHRVYRDLRSFALFLAE